MCNWLGILVLVIVGRVSLIRFIRRSKWKVRYCSRRLHSRVYMNTIENKRKLFRFLFKAYWDSYCIFSGSDISFHPLPKCFIWDFTISNREEYIDIVIAKFCRVSHPVNSGRVKGQQFWYSESQRSSGTAWRSKFIFQCKTNLDT